MSEPQYISLELPVSGKDFPAMQAEAVRCVETFAGERAVISADYNYGMVYADSVPKDTGMRGVSGYALAGRAAQGGKPEMELKFTCLVTVRLRLEKPNNAATG